MYVGIEEIREAAKKLTPSGFKLYLYFVENEDGWEFNFSPKDFMRSYNVAESTFRNAKHELIDKGYIIEEKNNHFVFYSNPEDNQLSKENLMKELIRIAERIKEYSEEDYENFKYKAYEISQLKVEKRKNLFIELLKEMRTKLDEL